MSAEILRRAASLMRERAEASIAVFGGEFTAAATSKGGVGGWPFTLRNGDEVLADRLDRSDAEHIASWHPAVALLVADWLDSTAGHDEQGLCACDATYHALAVARAYLGESS